MNRLEDDIRAVLRSQADAMQVPEPHPGSPTVRLIGLQRTPTQPKGRNLWPIVVAAAAAVVGIAASGLVIATREDPTREVATAAQPATVVQPPTEFTACFTFDGGDHSDQTNEQVDLPDGETTIERQTQTWQLVVTDVSDPRLDGTWHATAVDDVYSGPGSDGLIIGTWTQRIENADGAWQGSHQSIDFPDGQAEGGSAGLYVMIGEGAYEGLTAFTVLGQATASRDDTADCPNIRGYITPSA